MSAKYQLDEDPLELGFILYGLYVSTLEEYKWILKINQVCGLQLLRVQDFKAFKNGKEYSFSQYDSTKENSDLDIQIFAHKSHSIMEKINNSLFESLPTQEFIFPKYRNFNFILKLNSPPNPEFLLHLQAQSEILEIQELDITNFKELENFIA